MDERPHSVMTHTFSLLGRLSVDRSRSPAVTDSSFCCVSTVGRKRALRHVATRGGTACAAPFLLRSSMRTSHASGPPFHAFFIRFHGLHPALPEAVLIPGTSVLTHRTYTEVTYISTGEVGLPTHR